VELWDFGIADDGGFYYVMELLDGLELDRLVKRYGPVASERAIYLLRQVCHSLGEAETCGLVHRDIKPANHFVCQYGNDYDFVKVLDFGIVKATAASSPMKTLVTSESIVQGTPAFIAPEQALGISRIDNRADVYATGCVAYWLLTGQLLFTAETSIDMLLKHAHSVPTPHRPDPNCRFRLSSMTWFWHASPKIRPTVRNRRGSCRGALARLRGLPPGARTEPAIGGLFIGLCHRMWRRVSSTPHNRFPISNF
jgi:serine/threonine protein kinase